MKLPTNAMQLCLSILALLVLSLQSSLCDGAQPSPQLPLMLGIFGFGGNNRNNNGNIKGNADPNARKGQGNDGNQRQQQQGQPPQGQHQRRDGPAQRTGRDGSRSYPPQPYQSRQHQTSNGRRPPPPANMRPGQDTPPRSGPPPAWKGSGMFRPPPPPPPPKQTVAEATHDKESERPDAPTAAGGIDSNTNDSQQADNTEVVAVASVEVEVDQQAKPDALNEGGISGDAATNNTAPAAVASHVVGADDIAEGDMALESTNDAQNDDAQQSPAHAAEQSNSLYSSDNKVDMEWGLQSQQQPVGAASGPGGWGVPPPPPQHQQQQHANEQGYPYPPPDEYYMHQSEMMMLHAELDDSRAREDGLAFQIHNMTTALSILEEREQSNLHQLDILNERIIDFESRSAQDHNTIAEYEANRTSFLESIGALQDDVKAWEDKCAVLEEQLDDAESETSQWKKDFKSKCREVEELAIAIENLRLAEKERQEYMSLRRPKQQGLFGWLYSSLFGVSDTRYGGFDNASDEIRDDAYDMAKSSLLRALQMERENVEELETMVSSLEQNNSAISDMVQSRDVAIEELNGRVATFDEDKMVLKAALRQLQKEINEEAPKTQKLMEELETVRQELVLRNNEIDAIIGTHQDELKSLQLTIDVKQQAISEKDSNLTAVGTYVDRLEERLTSFAILRRDMEQREKKCKEIEASMQKREEEIQVAESKVEAYETEQTELKTLLEELVEERTVLQKEKRKLITEGEFQRAEEEQLRSKLGKLETDLMMERETKIELEKALRAQEQQVMMLRVSKEEMELQLQGVDELKTGQAQLQKELTKLRRDKAEIEKSLDVANRHKQSLLADVDNLSSMVQVLQSTEDDREQKVPLRSIRKELSKRTGLHGIITPSSKMMAGTAPLSAHAETESLAKKSTRKPSSAGKTIEEGKSNGRHMANPGNGGPTAAATAEAKKGLSMTNSISPPTSKPSP